MVNQPSLRTATFDWVDLSTLDVDAALTFYTAVLGWDYTPTDTPAGTYHVARANGHDAAGLMGAGPDRSGPGAQWTLFVRVASLDETLAAVVNADGSVAAAPMDIPGGARVAVVADPTGAMFALIEGGPEPGPDEPPLRRAEHGAVAWCELMTRNPHEVVNFYDAVFGWRPELDTASGYATFRLGDLEIGGLMATPDEVPADVPAFWMVYFTVDDVAAAADAVVGHGGSVVRPPTTLGPMTFAVVADGQDATFGLLSTASVPG